MSVHGLSVAKYRAPGGAARPWRSLVSMNALLGLCDIYRPKNGLFIVRMNGLARPSPASSLRVTDRSFQYASPHLWNQLPFSLREPVSPLYAYLNPSFCSPLPHPSPLHSFTLKSKLTSLVNRFPHRSLTIDISD